MEEIKVLIIDALLPPSISFDNKNSKTFFNSLGLEEKTPEVATTLANKSFSHSLSIIGNISSNIINSVDTNCNTIDLDPFTYIATDQYLSNKFYRIMIDIGASKHSTADYG